MDSPKIKAWKEGRNCFFSFIRSYRRRAQICAGTVRSRTTHLVKSRVGGLSQVVQVFEKIASIFLQINLSCLLCWFVARKNIFWTKFAFHCHFHFPGHFSQVVWRDSTQLGVGLAQKDGKVYHHHRHNFFPRCHHDHHNLLVTYLVQMCKDGKVFSYQK